MSAVGDVTLYLTTSTGQVLNLGTAADTSTAYIETKALDFGKTRFVKFLESLNVEVTERVNHTNMLMQVYGSDAEDGPFELVDSIQVAEEDPMFTDPPGFRYFKFRLYDGLVVSRWRLSGLEVWGELGGMEF